MVQYPSAKIILTTRSPESWQQSMLRTIHTVQLSHFNRLMLLFADREAKSLSSLLDLIIRHYFRDSIPEFGVEVFEEHNKMVRDTALKERRDVLEFRLGDSWEPLCGFLNKPVPETKFPNVNSSEDFREAFITGKYGLSVILPGMLVFVGLATAWIILEMPSRG